jgi:O-antigen/teichoic acid export membrane protein
MALAVVLAEAADLGLQGIAVRALVARTAPLAGLLRAKAVLSAAFLLPVLALVPFAPLLAPLLLYFAGAGWAEILGVVLRARGRRVAEASLILLLRAAGFGLVVAVLARAGGPVEAAWALAASTLAPILLGAALVRGGPPEEDSAPSPGVLSILRSSWPLAVNGGLTLLSLRAELLIMAALRPPEDVGLFAAALQVVQPLGFVPAALAAGAMPALTREALRGADDGVRRRTAALIALVAVPATVGLLLVAGPVALVFGPAYGPAKDELRVLALAIVPLFLNGLLTQALVAADRASRLPMLTVVRVLSAATLAVALVPRLSGLGAALGFLASEALLLVLAMRSTGAAGFRVAWARPVALALLLSLPMAAVVLPLRGQLVAAVAAGGAAYAAAVLGAGALFPRLRRDLGYS